mmetsp:Transcript_5809/g.12329  ORF Transcript_5809/g.12329 Transcript_5809/m.12329 type:complete len:462 (-) Transcript_5809:456-1841(-)
MYDMNSIGSGVHERTPISARAAAASLQQPRSHFKQTPSNTRRQQQQDNASIQNASQNSTHSDDELGRLVSPPKKNRCTLPVASFSLVVVAVALIVTWQVFPTEEIVVKFLPKFEAPASPYMGEEAPGTATSDSDQNNGDGGIDIDIPLENEVPISDATSVPSFMKCPIDSIDELCCNGSPQNCELRVNETMFATLHNAMSTEEGDFTFGFNHYKTLEKAMVAGYRGINLDVCNCNGKLQFCHNVCDYGERVPQEVFSNVVNFLKEYPSEVIILIFQATTEKGPIVWNDLYDEMKQVEDFEDMLYVHQGEGKEWPLMGDLVKSNKRIVTFYFNGGTCTDDICPEPFLPFFKYTAETEYQSANLDELRNIQYSCQLTRGPGGFKGDFFAVNNFVTPPDPEASAITNTQKFLSERLTSCANFNGKRPNFVYVDFWGEGVTSQLVQYANKQMASQKEKEEQKERS